MPPDNISALGEVAGDRSNSSAPLSRYPTGKQLGAFARQSRYQQEKTRSHVRRVRSPRFTDAEWKRVAEQADRLVSVEESAWAFTVRKRMTAHEFVRVASLAVAAVMEELPRGDKPPPIWDLIREAARIARTPAPRQQKPKKQSPPHSTKKRRSRP